MYKDKSDKTRYEGEPADDINASKDENVAHHVVIERR